MWKNIGELFNQINCSCFVVVVVVVVSVCFVRLTVLSASPLLPSALVSPVPRKLGGCWSIPGVPRGSGNVADTSC